MKRPFIRIERNVYHTQAKGVWMLIQIRYTAIMIGSHADGPCWVLNIFKHRFSDRDKRPAIRLSHSQRTNKAA